MGDKDYLLYRDNINKLFDFFSESIKDEYSAENIQIIEKTLIADDVSKNVSDAVIVKLNERLHEMESFVQKIEEQNISETLTETTNDDTSEIVHHLKEHLKINEDNITFIDNLSDYTSFVKSLDNAAEYVSRGQKDYTFSLEPSLFRMHKEKLSWHENSYKTLYKQRGIHYDYSIKNGGGEELSADGQHYGLPTPYLDFTEGHITSLLFALEEYDYNQNSAIVYFVNSKKYNLEAVKIESKLIDYSDPNIIQTYGPRLQDVSYFIKLGNSNERIHFQKGCFLKCAHADYGSHFIQRLSTFSKIAIINKNSKKDILIELFNLGITFESIYPDKEHMVKTIKFYYEEINGGIM